MPKGYDALKRQRKSQGLTQQSVADKAGIKLQQYQRFERGSRNIETAHFITACKVIEALNMDISEYYHNSSCAVRRKRQDQTAHKEH